MKFFLLAGVFFGLTSLQAESTDPYLVNKEAKPTVAAKDAVTLRESAASITVVAPAPIPSEMTDKSTAQNVAKEAAIGIGRTYLMRCVVKKKTHKGKTLGDAMVPSIELQQKVRELVEGADVSKVDWKSDTCIVTLSLKKSKLSKILHES